MKTPKRQKKIDVQPADLAAMQEAGIPSFTIEADSAFGVRCMAAVGELARQMLSREDSRAVEAKLRDFEIYEEQNRG